MLAKFSVTRPYTVLVAVILILILGIVSFVYLQVDLLPNIELPYIVIMTSYPGASPEEVEMMVTKPIEQVVATVNNIKKINSISAEGTSFVILEFNQDVNLDSATIEINGNLELIKAAWSDAVGSPMLLRLNPDMLPIMIASVDVEGMELDEVTQFVQEEIIPELESVNGVASVTGEGLLEKKIEVLLSQKKIAVLNEKILAAIDGELAETQAQLDAAQQEIDDGKTRLQAEKTKRNAEIAEGEKAINQALSEIEAAEKAILAGEQELQAAKTNLETALAELNHQEEGLLAQKEALLALEKLTAEQQAQLAMLEEQLQMIAAQKKETEAGYSEILRQVQELEGKKAEITAQKAALNSKKEELQQGKALLAQEMEKAEAQLAAGEKELKKNLEQFEAARDEAFAKAKLDGAITTEMIANILAAQNFAMPAGYVSEGETDYLVKVGDKFKNIEELKGLFLFDSQIEQVGKIYLEDVAEITYQDNAEDLYVKVNGNDAVILLMQKQSNFSTTEVAKALRQKIAQLQEEHEGLSITSLMDQGVYIEIVIASVLDNLLYGGILATLILIVFLKDLRPTLVIAVSIPISLIFAIALMYFSGITMNVISLAGLALGVGMLVDNSIVVFENIYRLRNDGLPAMEAALKGTNQVAAAITSSTLTTVCVFLPFVFTRGLTRQLFSDMGLTITYSLLASLIVALTLVPTVSSGLLKRNRQKEYKSYARFTAGYEKLLAWALDHKAIVMGGVTVLFLLSIYLATTMGTSFLPDMDSPQMSLSIEIPQDSDQDLIALTNTVIERIAEIEDIDTIGAFQGQGLMLMSGERSGKTMSLYLVLKEKRTMSNKAIEGKIRALTADLEAKITVNTNNIDLSALTGADIEIIIKGRDLDTLHELASEIALLVAETEGTIDVTTGTEEELTEIRVIVDKNKAMEYGLTVAQIFGEVNSQIARGKTATTLTIANQEFPVIVVAEKTRSVTRDDVADLSFTAPQSGEEVRLKEIAEIKEAPSPLTIRREEQERYMSVRAGIDGEHNVGLVSRELAEKLEDYPVPPGYKVEIAGEIDLINESLRDLVLVIILAIIFVYLIMVAQFQSLLSPFIVMFTIPLAFTGGLLALAFTGFDLSLIAVLGFLVLSGVVVNNGIVFVDYTNQLRHEGLKVWQALIEAGKTRLRPILMTAITTILGLSTLAFGVGTGAEALQPLAIVTVGGLTYATVLTLFVVPVMYALLHQKGTPKDVPGGEEF
ncbi:MAG: MMPL family transporter [Firmicutes bacterium]|nr:MMPL family transporter [Bacillota bacterium]